MEKYLVTIEFRYYGIPEGSGGFTSRNKKVTIGVYDTFDEACLNGNKLLENLESKFKLHVYPGGVKATKERFSKNGGCFGSSNTLVTNMAYLKTPFEFYAKIDTLKYIDINEAIHDAVESEKGYRKYKSEIED